MEIIILEKIYVKIKMSFIICQSSGFLLQILNGWIPYVIIIGEDEINSNKFKLKNMQTGDEKEISIDNIDTFEI